MHVQKLALGFFTADVVILGWRLGRLADLLRENDLATVHVLPKRYADLDHASPIVASITVTPISASCVGASGQLPQVHAGIGVRLHARRDASCPASR
jgi:hypothetical protein